MAPNSKFVRSNPIQDSGESKPGLGAAPDLRHLLAPITQGRSPRMIKKAKASRDDIVKYDPSEAKIVKGAASKGTCAETGVIHGRESSVKNQSSQELTNGFTSGLYSVAPVANKHSHGQGLDHSLSGWLISEQKTEARPYKQESRGQTESGFVVKSLTIPKTRNSSGIPKKSSTEPFRMLDLPGELILDIFEYVFDGGLVYMDEMESFCLPSKNLRPLCSVKRNRDCGVGIALFPTMMTGIYQPGGKTVCIKGKEMAFIRPKMPTQSRNTGLLLACKATASLLSPIMHKKSTFGFSSPNHIQQYLSKQKEFGVYPKTKYGLPRPEWLPLNSGNIKRLCLQIKDYGEPELQSFRQYRMKYYNRWTKACNMIVDKLPSLESISIDAHVPIMMNYEASNMTLKAIWVQPILAFGRAKNINTAAVTLSMARNSRRIAFEMASAFSEVLQRKILKFDDASALEAITFYKHAAMENQKHASPETKAFVKEQWEQMERCNGMAKDGKGKS